MPDSRSKDERALLRGMLVPGARRDLDDIRSDSDAKTFVETYGLAYFKEVKFGCMLTMTERASKSSHKQMTEMEVEVQAAYSKLSGSVGGSSGLDGSWHVGTGSTGASKELRAWGGDSSKITDNFDEWYLPADGDVDGHSFIVSYVLAPIYMLADPKTTSYSKLKASFDSQASSCSLCPIEKTSMEGKIRFARSEGRNMCLSVKGNNAEPGAYIITLECDSPGSLQDWILAMPKENGWAHGRIKLAAHPQYCIAAEGGKIHEDGTNFVLRQCVRQGSHDFYHLGPGKDSTIRIAHSSKVMRVYWNNWNGAYVKTSPATNSDTTLLRDQMFELPK